MPGAFIEEGEDDRPILVWTGTLADIPAGWLLCDGNNGTPDMRERFVRGTSNSDVAPGGVGGQDSLTLTETELPSHSHSGSTSTDGDHTHTVRMVGYNDRDPDTGEMPSSGDGNHSGGRTTRDGYHGHSLSFGSSGGTSSIDNRPAYYEVAYITPT